jgi:uracil-DNA glycosylase
MASPGHHPHSDSKRRAPAREPDSPPQLESLAALDCALDACRRCTLFRYATQAVPGEGARHADIMLVGEAPGDAEDLSGRPFVGPAGALLDRALTEAGLERGSIYITNAVKHFKYEPRGKRRLHVKPAPGEIHACNQWLQAEVELVKPRLVIALGATAARALMGKIVTINQTRGSPLQLDEHTQLWVTVHPSYLLRIPDEVQRRSEYRRFVQELQEAQRSLGSH